MDTTLADTKDSSLNWIITDAAGTILDVSAAAAELLNVSRMHLRRRSLLNFFNADRPEWNRLLRLASQGHNVERAGSLRPRDRRPQAVYVEVTEVRNDPAMRAFEWRLSLVEVCTLKAAG
jgi:PAS domain-containing protein